jgi:hypothetical protein
MKWVRGFDGLLCFGFAVFFTVATVQDFFLPSIAVTGIVYPNYKAISEENVKGNPPEVCVGPLVHASLTDVCSCMHNTVDFKTGLNCTRDHHGLPAQQKQIGRVNPNFFFFHIFLMSFVYQLVIRNSLELDFSKSNRDIQVGVVVMFATTMISVAMCLFNFDEGVYLFVLLNFMPHQILLLIVAYLMYNNAHFDEISDEFRGHYKKAIFSGVYNIATIPFMGLLVCVMNSWTTMPMLQFVYSTLMLIAIAEMAYNCCFIDANKDNGDNAAKYRMRQAIYLLLVSLLITFTVVTLNYFPHHHDTVHRVIGAIFVGLLWVLHLFFDCTKSSLDSYQHEKCFNQYDGFVAMIRYGLLMFAFYVVWGTAI